MSTGKTAELGQMDYLFIFEKNNYMKSIVQLVLIMMVMLPFTGSAQTTKAAPWPEAKAFHEYISSTFHPSEEGNYKPLREKTDSMLISAKAWQASKIPDNYKPDLTKETLEKLVKQCELIANAVKEKMADDKLKPLVIEAHEIFHKITGECRKS